MLINRITAIASVVALSASASLASLITQTITVSPVRLAGSQPYSDLSFNFSQFDPSLGTLNSVFLTLTPTLGAVGSSAQNYSSAYLTVNFGVAQPRFGVASPVFPSLSTGWSSTASLEASYLSAPSSVTDRALGFSFTALPASTAVPTAGFIGLGSYALDARGYGSANAYGNIAGAIPGWYGYVGGVLQVDYDYTPAPVPEPATYIAGALLLLPFGAHVIRRLRASK